MTVRDDSRARVVVIGGGISGLATARRLLDEAPDLDVTLLESGLSLGGTISTESDHGFVIEGGPTGFMNRHPSTVDLARRLGLEDHIIAGDERKRRRYVFRQGGLHRFPSGPGSAMRSGLLSTAGLARMMLEPLVPFSQGEADEDVQSFVRRRLGREAADRLADPLITGIYAGDPSRLSVQATLPQLAMMERERRSLIVTLLRRNWTTRNAAPSPHLHPQSFLSFRGGFGQLVRALRNSLGPHIQSNSPAIDVRPVRGGFVVEVDGPQPRRLVAEAVVSATPAPAAQRFLSGLDRPTDHLLSTIEHAPVAVVALGYLKRHIPHPLDGFGYLVPSSEGGSVLGVLWPTRIFPGARGPDDSALFQVIMGGTRDPEAAAREEPVLVERARQHVGQALRIEAFPKLYRVFRHLPGLPQYPLHHLDRLRAAEASLASRLPGLFLTGAAFRGVGLNACTTDSERVAAAVIDHVRTGPRVEQEIVAYPKRQISS